MKGWFERSGWNHILNNKSACGRKRHFSERIAKKISRNSKTLNPYQCSICKQWHLTSMTFDPRYDLPNS